MSYNSVFSCLKHIQIIWSLSLGKPIIIPLISIKRLWILHLPPDHWSLLMIINLTIDLSNILLWLMIPFNLFLNWFLTIWTLEFSILICKFFFEFLISCVVIICWCLVLFFHWFFMHLSHRVSLLFIVLFLMNLTMFTYFLSVIDLPWSFILIFFLFLNLVMFLMNMMNMSFCGMFWFVVMMILCSWRRCNSSCYMLLHMTLVWMVIVRFMTLV